MSCNSVGEPNSTINQLPDEILLPILHSVPFKWIVPTALTCKKWAGILLDPANIKIKCIESGLHKTDDRQSWVDFAKAQAHVLARWRATPTVRCFDQIAQRFRNTSPFMISIDRDRMAWLKEDRIEITDTKSGKILHSFQEQEEDFDNVVDNCLCHDYFGVSYLDKAKLYHFDGKVVEIPLDEVMGSSLSHPSWFIGCFDDAVKVYNPLDGSLLYTLPCKLPDMPTIRGNTLLVREQNQNYFLWDLHTGECLGKHMDKEGSDRYAFNGTQLVTFHLQHVRNAERCSTFLKITHFGHPEKIIPDSLIEDEVTGYILDGDLLALKTTQSQQLTLINLTEEKPRKIFDEYAIPELGQICWESEEDFMYWEDDRTLCVARCDGIFEKWTFGEQQIKN